MGGCIRVWVYEWVYGCMNVWVYEWVVGICVYGCMMHVWVCMIVWARECVRVWVYGRMWVYVGVWVYGCIGG